MKACFEFEIKDNDDFIEKIVVIDEYLSGLKKITLTCSCGVTTESGNHLTSSPEEQSDKDFDFIKNHTNCKGETCLTNTSQIN